MGIWIERGQERGRGKLHKGVLGVPTFGGELWKAGQGEVEWAEGLGAVGWR